MLSTFQRAICKSHFIYRTGINKINFEKRIHNLTPKAKGHLYQECANLQSTKVKDTEILNDFEPEKKSDKDLQKCSDDL